MFEETVGRVLADTVTPDVIAAAETGSWPTAMWQAIEENGLTVAAAPETSGGVGGSWHDTFGLVRAAGRHAVPAPLAETILANWLLGSVGLTAIPGPASIGRSEGATLSNGRYDGRLADVPWGGRAQHVVTVLDERLVVLSVSDAEVTTALNTAREPRDTLIFSNVAPVAVARLGNALPVDAIRLGGAMIRSAQIAGALQRLLDMAVDYASQRTQFGKAIGSFQAVQHQIAILAQQAALTSSVAEAAFATADQGLSLLSVASAKSVASEAAGRGASIAHAVFGAIGFTYEHSMHYTTRRLWSWRSEFGSQTFWAQQLGNAACAGGAAAFWPALTTGSLGR